MLLRKLARKGVMALLAAVAMTAALAAPASASEMGEITAGEGLVHHASLPDVEFGFGTGVDPCENTNPLPDPSFEVTLDSTGTEVLELDSLSSSSRVEINSNDYQLDLTGGTWLAGDVTGGSSPYAVSTFEPILSFEIYPIDVGDDCVQDGSSCTGIVVLSLERIAHWVGSSEHQRLHDPHRAVLRQQLAVPGHPADRR